MDERGSSSTNSRRSRSSSGASSESSSGERRISAPSQKVRPITAARCSNAFAWGSSRSMRAAIKACSVSGIRPIPAEPSSASIRTVSSRKSGLPSVLSSSRRRSSSLSSLAGHERVHELLAVAIAERLELDRGRTHAPAAPAGTDVEQFRSRQRDQQQRRVAHPGREVLDQLEQRLLCPVNVLEDEHERLLLRHSLRPLARGPGDLLLAALRVDGLEDARSQAEQVGDHLVLAGHAELLDRDVERVVVDDPGRAFDHLGERPVGDPLAVREAAAGKDGGALQCVAELVRKPALADTGLAVDREQVGPLVAQRALVRVAQKLELGVAPDERGLLRPRLRAVSVRAQRPPRPDLLVQALEVDRADVLDLDPPEREPVCGRTDQQLPGLAGLLQACGERDGLAGGERRVAVVGDDLARLDPGASLELELVDRVHDREPRAHGALSVVLVRLRDPEGRHDRVAGELLDDPAVRDHAMRDPLEEGLDTATHDLGIRARDEGGRIDEIDKQDRGKLAFHACSVKRAREPVSSAASSIMPCSTPRFSRPTTCAGSTRRSSTRRAPTRSGARSWRSSSRSGSRSGTTCASPRPRWPRP